MSTEQENCERNITLALALAWFDGKYTEEQAQLLTELQFMDFNNVKHYYSELYHDCEVRSQ